MSDSWVYVCWLSVFVFSAIIWYFERCRANAEMERIEQMEQIINAYDQLLHVMDDAISRKEVLKAINDICSHNQKLIDPWLLNDLTDAIETMPLIQNRCEACGATSDCFTDKQNAVRAWNKRNGDLNSTGWIPVKERLPIENDTVLLSYGNCVMDGYRTGSKFYHTDYYYGYDVELYSVTAWMPLPEPYEEEPEDDADESVDEPF